MPKRVRNFEEPRRGDRLNARTIMRWLRDQGFSREVPLPGAGTLVEPCYVADVVNVDTQSIQAFHAISLDRSTEITSPALFVSRSFQARNIVNALSVPVSAIALDRIPAGSAGKAYVSGVCAAKMNDLDGSELVAGGGTIIWQEDVADDLDERWAVVRLGGSPRERAVQIIGGQTVSTVGCIMYNDTDPTLTQLYDADNDTVFPTGLGNAWIMNSKGQQSHRVLVRHDFAGATGPLVAGWAYIVRSSRLLTVASGDDAGEAMLVHTVTWQL